MTEVRFRVCDRCPLTFSTTEDATTCPRCERDDLRAKLAACERDRDEAKDAALWAFLDGAKWWQFTGNGSTAFPSEQNEMLEEAKRRYPFKPHTLVMLAENDRDLARRNWMLEIARQHVACAAQVVPWARYEATQRWGEAEALRLFPKEGE